VTSKSKNPNTKGLSATRASKIKATCLEYLGAAGPGLVTGASDDDPSGVATYSQVGAKYGPTFLWTVILTLPLMMGVQEMCDRTALATGSGLGELAAKHFGRVGRAIIGALLLILIIANTLNIAADLVAIGSGMNLLNAGPTWLWALLAGGVITLIMVKDSSSRINNIFKILAAALLVYIVVAIMVTKQWGRILDYTFVPHVTFNRTYLSLLVAVLGTTISPYLFFWQSADRLEEMRLEPEGGRVASPLPRRSPSHAALKQHLSRIDVFSGMAFSNVVMFAIIAATAETLHVHNVDNIQSAAQAANSLKPLAGHFASAIFALGFIGSGLLAVPVLAASGSIGLSGLLKKNWGFSLSIRKAPLFYGLVGVGTIGGTALSLVAVNPIKLLVFVAVINGVIAAPLLVVVLIVSNNRELMGKYVNGRLAKTVGGLACAVMALASIALFATGGFSF
jgi:NRAMP (natural resistance-associated macrophage protein)-like metal ion transporter